MSAINKTFYDIFVVVAVLLGLFISSCWYTRLHISWNSSGKFKTTSTNWWQISCLSIGYQLSQDTRPQSVCSNSQYQNAQFLEYQTRKEWIIILYTVEFSYLELEPASCGLASLQYFEPSPPSLWTFFLILRAWVQDNCTPLYIVFLILFLTSIYLVICL